MYKPPGPGVGGGEARLHALLRRADRQIKQIREVRGLVESHDGPFWKNICVRLQVRKDALEKRRMADWRTMTDPDMRVLHGQVEILNEVMRMPADLKDGLNAMENQHRLLVARVREMKKKNGTEQEKTDAE